MRKGNIIFVGLILLSMVAIGAGQTTMPQGAKNILGKGNPGFESPVRNGKIPGWTAAYGACQISNDALEGKQSLQVSENCKVYSNQLIRVEPGYRYRLSGWGKFKNFAFLKQNLYGAGIGLEELNARKQLQGDWYPMYQYLNYAEGDKDWNFAGGLIIRPKETTVYLRPGIYVSAAPGSKVCVDKIVVWKEKIPELKVEGRVNVVENGSFEVRYDMGVRANGYNFEDMVGKNAVCVEDVKRSGLASMKMAGECTAYSGMEFLSANTFRMDIAVRTDGVSGGKAFARIAYFDANRKIIKTQSVAELTGTNDWKVHGEEVKDLDPAIRFVRWEFGLEKGATGTAWFDDLVIEIPTTYRAFPVRKKDTANARVTVDCAVRKGLFSSPLSAYDHHNIDRAYSPTIGTAGKFVDGPGHWYQERMNLGFKYVRIHHIYQANICTVEKGPDGQGKVSFGSPRTNWPEGDKAFPAIVSFDKEGKMITDFSAIKYVLDKAALPGGCKPIITLEPVPRCMARGGDEHNGPANYKDWEELNYRFVKFLVDAYGKEEVKTWIFETGNEPGNEWEWHGYRSDEKDTLLRLQDYIVAGVTRALPEAFIAGPSGSAANISFDEMLEHCAEGINEATGEKGTKIDAISYHGYLGGHAGDISWRQMEDLILRFQGYIDRFYQKTGKRLLLLNTEYTPIFFDGGRDPKHPTHEQNNHIQAIATLHSGFFSHRLGVSLMTFFFQSPFYFGFTSDPEHTPEFQGLPTCITFHGIFNPVCRAFQMMSWLNGGVQVSAESETDPIYSLAVVDKNTIKVLCYSFDVNPTVKYTTDVELSIDPAGLGNTFKATRYELSATKGNSWYLAQQIKLTQADCIKNPAIVDKINTDSELKPENQGLIKTQNGKLNITFRLPAYSAVLYVFEKKE